MLGMTESQLLIATGLAGGILGWLGSRAAFLFERKVTGAKDKEQVAYLKAIVDLSETMQRAGMTIEDARGFEAMMRAPAANHGDAARQVVGKLVEPAAFQSTYVLKARADAAYEVAEAKLRQALLDLELLLRDDEGEALSAAQEAWQSYRRSLEDRALRQFLGGTHAPLAMTISGLTETERRTEELRAEVEERAAMYAH